MEFILDIPLSLGLMFSAFAAGLVTFLAPCTLPLVPGYLAFISGVDAKTLADPEQKRTVRRKVMRNALTFVLGFSLVFIFFGAIAGLIGMRLVGVQALISQLGGALIILFGLSMLGLFRLPFFEHARRMPLPRALTVGTPASSFLIGGTFAVGWTPCVGPLLGAILLLAGTSATVGKGALLLAIFSLGLAIPFLVVAFAFGSATSFISRAERYFKWVTYIGAALLIFIGLLLVTGNFGLLITWGFELFSFFNYQGILKAL